MENINNLIYKSNNLYRIVLSIDETDLKPKKSKTKEIHNNIINNTNNANNTNMTNNINNTNMTIMTNNTNMNHHNMNNTFNSNQDSKLSTTQSKPNNTDDILTHKSSSKKSRQSKDREFRFKNKGNETMGSIAEDSSSLDGIEEVNR